MLLDMPAPKINAEDTVGSVQFINKWLIALIDNINECLSNLDDGNMSDSFVGTLHATKVIAETVISTTVITQNLYSTFGNIAELTVDRLETEDKVDRYKAKDKTDINYIRAQDQSIKLITGATDGTVIPHKDRNGEVLYWKDADKLAMGVEVTSYPVMVYQYTELVKSEYSFKMDNVSGQYIPMLTLGAGSGTGENGKAHIYKGLDGLHIDYLKAADGTLRSIILNDSGIFMTPYELESLDFYNNGFRAKYSGETFAYTWTKDGSGRITSLITEDAVSIPVTWNGGDM